ncbi:MAG: hypothetical protein A3B74_03385 [Candidatus Kerfeldbacteria bacterium RIFCSPHIGHO2_02_FULL_42_14]|uniref:Nudix hydrolase domain-containing protein n=1 Tax=Candidatus Kerfeldbacteria bacterium RIFCSPHIGHO2_02_FULL_42_14 TaxID=1798540 RepID=A0A1G2APH4_9BACT|nr:MAG: hypothetical protein A3B74_03385 [Candidatus Kerfeldbacteria bacterium RIFCSPHIGHO2_02_FULL_42_14]OGY80947.1 MAG: hypothetical protein A3E60_03295 [Candidatus Kerfeldbacteria bacterium RIFCSPHIGHO2_12_FULL_42_13]OGY84181.1 MAG: hypothetical protein A3I91_01700 [Candidatus Kerfeldbacteria bacterium RIFCSPLOWO2_02_FULL_42_19]
MEILTRSYTETGYQTSPAVFLPDDEYGRALQCCIPACTDIVPINTRERIIYLARRALKPMTGWWWIGGRMTAPETKEEAVARNFQRETGLELTHERFQLAAVFDYRWKNRAQAPQDIGCHMFGYTFTVELTTTERTFVSANLNKEFETSAGLTSFNRERLVDAQVFPAILDLYDHVFPPVEEVECELLQTVSSDSRREICEFGFASAAIQDFTIYDGSRPLGQHYHRKKFEVFYFLEGGGLIWTAHVSTDGKIIGPIQQFKVEPGVVIKIPPFHTHRLDLVPNTRFVAFSSKPFDADDMPGCPIVL